MKALLILTSMTLISCNFDKEIIYCAENGFQYVRTPSGMAPDFNKLGLPKRCEPNESEQ
jgi:hypothetical protein